MHRTRQCAKMPRRVTYQDIGEYMSETNEKIERFTSHMLNALRALSTTQLELVNAKRWSRISTDELDRPWELLWGNLRSVVSLASIIRASVTEHVAIEAVDGETLMPDTARTPLVSEASREFQPLLEAIDDAMRCAEQMSRSTSDAYERLIYVGHGESDCAHTVSMVRLYGHAAQSLLETIKSELQPAGALVTN
jgi:hypothetical protein